MSIRVKDLLIDGNVPLHENNFNNWVPSLTGEGASGMWNINVSGYAKNIYSSIWNNVSGDLILCGISGVSGQQSIFAKPEFKIIYSGEVYYLSTPELLIDGTNIKTQLSNLNTEIQARYSSKVTRTKNTVLAAPNGSDGVASFRTLVTADIPNLDASKITTGTLPTIRGGTGASTAAGARTNLEVPSKTGNGASGTWGISITGNAATADKVNASLIFYAMGEDGDTDTSTNAKVYNGSSAQYVSLKTLASATNLQTYLVNGTEGDAWDISVNNAAYVNISDLPTDTTAYVLGSSAAGLSDIYKSAIRISGNGLAATNFYGNATTADSLNSNAGSATKPVYFSSGKPIACDYNLREVLQSNSAASDFRPLVVGTTHGAAGSLNTTVTGQLYVNNNLYACPNTGKLYATNFSTANGSSGGLWVKDSDSTEFGAIYFNGSNLWIGAYQANARHHSGSVYISAGVNAARDTANETIFITVPTADGTGSSGSYPALHSNNVSITWSGDQHINFRLAGADVHNSKSISLTIPYATTNDAGLMSAADKTKLDGLSSGSTSSTTSGMKEEFDTYKDEGGLMAVTEYETPGNASRIYTVTINIGNTSPQYTMIVEYRAVQAQESGAALSLRVYENMWLQAQIVNSKMTFKTIDASGSGEKGYITHVRGYY